MILAMVASVILCVMASLVGVQVALAALVVQLVLTAADAEVAVMSNSHSGHCELQLHHKNEHQDQLSGSP
jgi:hypothetical protein